MENIFLAEATTMNEVSEELSPLALSPTKKRGRSDAVEEPTSALLCFLSNESLIIHLAFP